MATVTGFTAERMLEIENTTVVDGTVTGDNLILMTREGTPIDAGNVRGPVGPVGPAGPVSSINDQTGPAYAPRIFTNKAALDSAWPAAPRGATAVTTDDESIWEKSNSGWSMDNGVRIFASVAERNARWPSAPIGALCVTTDLGYMWQYYATGWGKPWQMPWGEVHWSTVPGDQSIHVSYGQVQVTNLTTGPITIPNGRRLVLHTDIKYFANTADLVNHITFGFFDNGVLNTGTNAYKNAPGYATAALTSRFNSNGLTHTYAVRLNVGDGWVNVLGSSSFLVTDIGPV